MIRKFRQKYPNIKISLTIDRPNFLLEKVYRNDLDVAILLDNLDLSPFETNCLLPSGLGLYQAKKAKLGPMSGPYYISSYPQENALIRKQYRHHYLEEMPVELEVGSWEVISQLTMQAGIGVFPDFLVKHTYLKDHLKRVRNSFLQYELNVCRVRKTNDPLALRSKAFMNFDFF